MKSQSSNPITDLFGEELKGADPVELFLGVVDAVRNADMEIVKNHHNPNEGALAPSRDMGKNLVDHLQRLAEARLFSIMDDSARNYSVCKVSFLLTPNVITIVLPNDESIDLIEIPSGQFLMGSKRDGERPITEVSIESFFMSVDPITVGQWNAVKSIPGSMLKVSTFEIPTLPVTNVSYKEVCRFCKVLSTYTGLDIKIPSESQWEYSCRAGSTEDYNSGNEPPDDANYHKGGGADFYIDSVGKFCKNDFGLRGMHGNVHEMTGDRFYKNHLHNPGDGGRAHKKST